jgi:mycofactocin precursor
MPEIENQNDSTTVSLVEETLVEEVMIDGMCGVY